MPVLSALNECHRCYRDSQTISLSSLGQCLFVCMHACICVCVCERETQRYQIFLIPHRPIAIDNRVSMHVCGHLNPVFHTESACHGYLRRYIPYRHKSRRCIIDYIKWLAWSKRRIPNCQFHVLCCKYLH